ncbi:MAG: hypothetical protein KIT72_16640 [Polyangiaceae bacterium]|nr:hypothetical protein [Polyangiaceae bacterium]MCW5792046.1 hypothetical protein [Polyangiaceae bacterium]
MRPYKPLTASLVCAALITWAAPGQAQNYREFPIGGRTATMGGAGTAAGNDSAMPYLNPAGLVGVPGDVFAVSATVYSVTRRSFDDFFYPSGTPETLGYQQESESFTSASVGELPSSVMYFSQPGDPEATIQHRIGFSLIVPSARRIAVVASVAGRFTNAGGRALETESINAHYTRYYAGPSYALGIGPDLRLGASLYGVYHRSTVTTSRTSSFSFLGGSVSSTFAGQKAQIAEGFSVVPVVGVQLRLVSDLWLGAGVAAPSFPIAGKFRFNSDSSGVDPDPTTGVPRSVATTSTADTEYRDYTPLRLNAGVAFDPRQGLSLAGDVHVYLKRTDTEVDGAQRIEQRRSGELTRQFVRDVSYSTMAEQVIDLSLGAEYAFSEVVALRAGGFTDMAAVAPVTERPDQAGRFRLNRFGGTLGVGLKSGSFDSTVGVLLAHGVGHYGASDPWVNGAVVPVRTTETTGMLILSGAITSAEAKKAIRDTLPVDAPVPDLDGEAKVQVEVAPSPRAVKPKPPPPAPPAPPDPDSAADQAPPAPEAP